MTDLPQIGTGLADIKVENNSTPAPVEQQSTPMVTTEPITPLEPAEVTTPVEPEAPAIPEPMPADKDNDSARERIQDKLRADELQRQLDELKPKEKVFDKEPDINDYATLDEYKDDFRKWAKAEGKREERESFEQAEKAKELAKIQLEVTTKEQAVRAKKPDYDSVISPIIPVISQIPLLKDFVAKNAMGVEVMYELGKNPAILDQIMKSNTWEASERLLGIAARLKNPAPVTVSNAPDPIKPIGSREVAKPKLVDLASKDINGYMAKRNKQELDKRRSN